MPGNRFDDQKNAGVNKLTLTPATYTSTQVGTGVDMSYAAGPIYAVIQLGAISDTSTLSITFTESATSGGTYTSVSGAPTIAPAGTDDATVVVSAPFEFTLPYVKATLTLGGSAISAVVGISLHAVNKSF